MIKHSLSFRRKIDLVRGILKNPTHYKLIPKLAFTTIVFDFLKEDVFEAVSSFALDSKIMSRLKRKILFVHQVSAMNLLGSYSSTRVI